MEQLALHLTPDSPEEVPEASALPPPPPEIAARIESFLGPLGSQIGQLFELMEVAETEIELAKARFPGRREELQSAFRFLAPTEVVQSETLYGVHVRELLERVASGTDLRPGTSAEMVGTLSKLSLVQPPSRVQTLLYMKLFRAMFPAASEEIVGEIQGLSPDRYEETLMDELEAELRRKLSRERDCHKG